MLAYDCYIDGVVRIGKVLERVTSRNELCSELVEKSIEDGLREIMGIKEDG